MLTTSSSIWIEIFSYRPHVSHSFTCTNAVYSSDQHLNVWENWLPPRQNMFFECLYMGCMYVVHVLLCMHVWNKCDLPTKCVKEGKLPFSSTIQTFLCKWNKKWNSFCIAFFFFRLQASTKLKCTSWFRIWLEFIDFLFYKQHMHCWPFCWLFHDNSSRELWVNQLCISNGYNGCFHFFSKGFECQFVWSFLNVKSLLNLDQLENIFVNIFSTTVL